MWVGGPYCPDFFESSRQGAHCAFKQLIAPNKQKSPSRIACEANEVAYTNRVQADQHAGAGGRILQAAGLGAVSTGFALGKIGFAGGEFLEPIGGGIPGAAAGAFIGGVVGAAGGVLTGAAKELGTYYLKNNSFFGFGNTYQTQLNANIQKNCGAL